MKKLLLITIALVSLSSCDFVSENDYERVEERCRQLENQNRQLHHDLKQAQEYNEGLVQELERYGHLVNRGAIGGPDPRVVQARDNLGRLRTSIDGERMNPESNWFRNRTDSIMDVLSKDLWTASERVGLNQVEN